MRPGSVWRWFSLLVVAAVVLMGFGVYLSLPKGSLLMATTTSTRDTGLLPYLLPLFTKDTGVEVRYITVGTGQALDAGRRGDADVVMVHAPPLEAAFMASGDGACRNELMYNRFVVVGPPADPAGVRNATSAADAFLRIRGAGQNGTARFESRADRSGTNTKELELWRDAGLNASTFGAWYERTDQGMGATLTITNQRTDAYTLSDDGTWYALKASLQYLAVLYGSPDPVLRNQYAVIPVAATAAHPYVKVTLAVEFARWLASARGQGLIAAYAVNGHAIFTPDYDPAAGGTC